MIDDERASLLAAVDAGAEDILDLSRWVTAHPELALEEYGAADHYIEYLYARGFEVSRPVPKLHTAFVARCGSKAAPKIALLAEMDALPELGHACGHSLSGPASLLAASALAEVLPKEALQLLVVGCPAEEIGAGKRQLVAAKVFDGVEAAIMTHASDMRRAHRLFLGNAKYEIVFEGYPAHAAACPEEGINALDAAVACYTSLALLRQQLPPEVRIHVIISEGGEVPNIIPARAVLQVWVRALEQTELEHTARSVKACAEGAALATATSVEIKFNANISPTMRPAPFLAEIYRQQLGELCLMETGEGPAERIGSSDITHVSQVVPTIHPDFPIGKGLALHTREFAAAVASPAGEQGLVEAAQAMVLTVQTLARNSHCRYRIKREHDGLFEL
jgi:amidohydrolase